VTWFHEAAQAGWRGPQDRKDRLPTADILPGNRVVFNIKGNAFRLTPVTAKTRSGV
jgi:mRNA interferase HigB